MTTLRDSLQKSIPPSKLALLAITGISFGLSGCLSSPDVDDATNVFDEIIRATNHYENDRNSPFIGLSKVTSKPLQNDAVDQFFDKLIFTYRPENTPEGFEKEKFSISDWPEAMDSEPKEYFTVSFYELGTPGRTLVSNCEIALDSKVMDCTYFAYKHTAYDKTQRSGDSGWFAPDEVRNEIELLGYSFDEYSDRIEKSLAETVVHDWTTVFESRFSEQDWGDVEVVHEIPDYSVENP